MKKFIIPFLICFLIAQSSKDSKMTVYKDGTALVKQKIIWNNIPERSIILDVPKDEMDRRESLLKPFKPKIKHGYLHRYARMVTSANTGAVLR